MQKNYFPAILRQQFLCTTSKNDFYQCLRWTSQSSKCEMQMHEHAVGKNKHWQTRLITPSQDPLLAPLPTLLPSSEHCTDRVPSCLSSAQTSFSTTKRTRWLPAQKQNFISDKGDAQTDEPETLQCREADGGALSSHLALRHAPADGNLMNEIHLKCDVELM